MENISGKDHKTNKYVLDIVKEKRRILNKDLFYLSFNNSEKKLILSYEGETIRLGKLIIPWRRRSSVG